MSSPNLEVTAVEARLPGQDRTMSNWRHGLRTLAFTAAAQSGIQLLGVVTGLVIVWLLPVREYAYYTIANAALGSLTVLTDCGVTQGALALGGKCWQEPAALGAVVAGGLRLRRHFALLALAIFMPFVFLQLRQQDASVGVALLVTASILPMLLSSIRAQVLEVAPRLHQQLAKLQRLQLAGAALRLLGSVTLVALLPFAWLANLGAGIAQIWTTRRIARLTGTLADLDAPADRGANREMRRLVTRAAPNAIYYALAGQITVWLIAVLGTTSAVAQVGALGRLAMVYNVVTAAFAVMVVPRFARAQLTGGPPTLAVFWRVQVLLLAPLLLIIALVVAFPEAALALLGHAYRGLTHEVVLIAVGGALGTLSSGAYALAAARGVIISPWIALPLALLLQVVLVLLLPVSTVRGVLWLGVLSNLGFWVLYSLNFTLTALYRRDSGS
jgi:hypothetical protein